MRNVIIAPDSFKGALSAQSFCRIVAEEVEKIFPRCKVRSLPIADGGEGTVDSLLLASGGRRVSLPVHGPFFQEVPGFYGLLPDGETAILEMAAAAGLPLALHNPNPCKTTTYGVGQLLRHAVFKSGARKLLLGLGGSATNDGGCGMAAALGVVFRNRDGVSFVPTGETLKDICTIDPSPARALLAGISIQALCDVDNPLFGPNGAAFVFAPQKGATEEMVRQLDDGLRHYGALLERLPGGAGVCSLPGGGAAGGLGAGLSALLGASLSPGADLLLDAAGFDRMLPSCDLVITGEGQLDSQSLRGKAVLSVCRRAKAKGVPVAAFAGAVSGEEQGAYDQGLTAVFPINRQLLSLEEALTKTGENLRAAARNLMRLIKAAEQMAPRSDSLSE
ncbi:MAG: glycerate kinase [Oscillospiraceae bacterium]|jgi:glycerate kinase